MRTPTVADRIVHAHSTDVLARRHGARRAPVRISFGTAIDVGHVPHRQQSSRVGP